MQKAERKNKLSKYPFASVQVGETFNVERSDVVSMKNSLTLYNKRHGESIAIDYGFNYELDKVVVTRIS